MQIAVVVVAEEGVVESMNYQMVYPSGWVGVEHREVMWMGNLDLVDQRMETEQVLGELRKIQRDCLKMEGILEALSGLVLAGFDTSLLLC